MLKIGKPFIPIAVAAAMLAAGAAPAYAATDTIYIDQPITLTDNSGRQLAATMLDTLQTAQQADDYDSDTDRPDDWAQANDNPGDYSTTRDLILARDLTDVTYNDKHQVATGTLHDPYTGGAIQFKRGVGTSTAVQIDHVVAFGEAWESGLSDDGEATIERYYNDPYVLLAVDGPSNGGKSDSDASEWLPSDVDLDGKDVYDCYYVARQIGIKSKYNLTVDETERQAMTSVLATCPAQTVPLESDGAYWESESTTPGTSGDEDVTTDEGQDTPTDDPSTTPDDDPSATPDDSTDDPATDPDDPSGDPSTDEDTQTDEDTADDSDTEQSKDENTATTTPADTKTDGDNLPQTGVRSPMFMGVIIIAIILLAAGIGILYYVMNRRNTMPETIGSNVEETPADKPADKDETESSAPVEEEPEPEEPAADEPDATETATTVEPEPAPVEEPTAAASEDKPADTDEHKD